jgi:tRNA(adenine34) deaminase
MGDIAICFSHSSRYSGPFSSIALAADVDCLVAAMAQFGHPRDIKRGADMNRHCDCIVQRTALHPTRRSILGALAALTILRPSSSLSAQFPAPATPEDQTFMRMAIDEARLADFPFGTVIVRHGSVLARGRNLGRTNDDPTAHGEMVAIRRGLADHGSEALKGCTLYTSGEPCAMCMGAILWCHFGRLVYAASIEQLSTKIGQIMLSSSEVAEKTPFASISITGGVLADEAMQLFDK